MQLVLVLAGHHAVNGTHVITQKSRASMSTFGLNLGGGVRSLLASFERFLTILEWMAQLTQ